MLGQSVSISGIKYQSYITYHSDSSEQGRFWKDQNNGSTDYDGSGSATVEVEATQGLIVLNLEYQQHGNKSTRRFIFKGESLVDETGEITAFSLRQKTEWVRYLNASNGRESENITVLNFNPGKANNLLDEFSGYREDGTSIFYYDSVDGGTHSKADFFSLDASSYYEDNWWLNPFSSTILQPRSQQLGGSKGKADVIRYNLTPSFEPDTIDIITNFIPKEKDRLVIERMCFGNSLNGTFRTAKNSKTLAKFLNSPTEFIYLRSSGEMFFNEDGAVPGYGDGGAFARFEGRPSLKASNIGFI